MRNRICAIRHRSVPLRVQIHVSRTTGSITDKDDTTIRLAQRWITLTTSVCADRLDSWLSPFSAI
jgi:hypothetical protein